MYKYRYTMNQLTFMEAAQNRLESKKKVPMYV